MNLGEDLHIEILMRLPAKSLMRFKCVQKSWNKLIKTPYFVSKRSKLHIRENPSLLIIEKSTNLKLVSCDSDNEKPILIKTLLFPNDVARIESYGSCNGVFCLKGIYPNTTNHNQLIMWNPTTNEVHLIPRAPSLGNCYIDESLYGFGVVNDDDFKVVRLSLSHNHRLSVFYLSLIEVYNLSTKSWTQILNRPSATRVTHQQPSRYNTLVNGVYHWITSFDRYNTATIFCFDFHNNRFQQLEGPDLLHAFSFLDEDVIEINGSLGYVVQSRYFDVVRMEIWIMKQNKWEKKYNIDPKIRRIYGLWNDCAEILGGKVRQKQLTSYDHHGNSIRQFQIDILENENLFMYEYVPSIALLSN